MSKDQGEPAPMACYPTPGTRLLGALPKGPVRGLRQATTGAVYAVGGDTVYKINPTSWAATALGTITPGLTTPVSMADNGLDMVIVDGSANGWKITLVGDVFAPIANRIEVLSPVTAITGTDPIVRDNARYTPFVPTIGGSMTRATVSLGTGFLGHMKCSVFSAGLGSVLGSARTITSPAAGVNDLLFASPIKVVAGGEYWLGFDCDQSAGRWNRGSVGAPGATSNTSFTSFPVAAPSPTPASPLIVTVTVESDPDAMFVGADRVDYLDTYLLFNKPNTPQFYSSDSLALTFDPLWFANKEAYSDLLVTQIVSKRDIILIGEKTTEVWTNVGKPDFPFESQPGVFIDHGIVAKYSASEYDNGVFWLTADRQGQGIVVMVAGYQSKRISTYAIENEISGYARISDAIGFCYQLGGHTFYVLTFPSADKTWVYDITTGLWHEWLWIDTNGEEHRHRANCYWPVNGTPVVGDWQNGNLYALDSRVFTDNGHPIKRVRSFPHVVADLKRVFFRCFIADMDVGDAPQAPVIVPVPPSTGGFRALPRPAGSTHGAANAISADGHVVVGSVQDGVGDHGSVVACYWLNEAAPVIIGPVGSQAYGVSGDGSAIVGHVNNDGTQPFIWTSAAGLVPFGLATDVASGISADGSRIFGGTRTGTGTNRQACHWTRSFVRTDLGFLPGDNVTAARGISGDGTWIVGESMTFPPGGDHLAWRWSAGTGMTSLGLVSGATESRAYGVSDNGALVVGDLSTPVNAAFSWTASGMVQLPQIPGASPGTSASAVSGDGTTIAGYTDYKDEALGDLNDKYFCYWTASGVLTVPVPVPLDPALPDTLQPTYPTGVSADGKTFTGYTFPGESVPWIYSLETPPPPDISDVPDVNLISLVWSDDRGHSWGSPVSQSIGDAGEYRTNLQWNRCGYARDRVWELSWTAPMPTALLGCYFDATPGQS
jgi:uncharacterized membrane protein